MIRNHKKFSELGGIEGLKKLLRTHVCYIYGVSDKMSGNEIREEPGSQEKEIIFKKKREGIASKLYGSLEFDEKEIDKIVKAETWEL
ncbi:hypothetical protein AKJ39_04985 [candidate division MSBL1 archaeon SCGC-AAA259J03]|uniref:Uncharacterized protein n=1 Tax=candidate division MSBL1 archaeon SCGC-AAA259J03 TaxID=1698269 RepID=A0A656YUN9_9EURY|nr:hypothetical protein AKJ39_04985 [candidate division MSBL1 archaeon SCGC-AAA259J03]